MNILKNSLKAFALIGILSFGSCEDDFNTVGSNIIDHSPFTTDPYDIAEITTYSKKITAVQTSDLPQYLLGAYNDPVYGLSEASLLTQLSLSSPDPDFGTDPVMDSVVLVLPYYSTVEETTEEGKTYQLDSLYGGIDPVKISVYESNYFLRDLDPETNFEEKQLYYSNQQSEFENNLGVLLAEETLVPNDEEVILFEEETSNGEAVQDTLKLSPRIRIHLPVGFFQEKVLDNEDSQVLLSNANFQSYLRGLYIKAQAINGDGHMTAFNLAASDAKVALYFTTSIDDPAQDNDETIEVSNSFDLNFQGNNVTVYNNDFQVDLTNQDSILGESNLYLKGGEGSMVVIELFSGPDTDGDGVSDELETLREKKWLINEANLTFVVNETLSPEGEKEPERVFIYDLKNNRVVVDYQLDFTASESAPLYSRVIHLGPLTEGESGNRHYKIRLTDHIRNIINNDSTNVKLGLSVSSNVNFGELMKLKNAAEETVSSIPAASVVSPEGTVLYGNAALDENKRVKLNIFYTEPE